MSDELPIHSVEDRYHHFLAYMGWEDEEKVRIAYSHGADIDDQGMPRASMKIKAVTKEIEDGLETVETIPEHVLEWLKSKVAAIKSHL